MDANRPWNCVRKLHLYISDEISFGLCTRLVKAATDKSLVIEDIQTGVYLPKDLLAYRR